MGNGKTLFKVVTHCFKRSVFSLHIYLLFCLFRYAFILTSNINLCLGNTGFGDCFKLRMRPEEFAKWPLSSF